MEFAFDCQVLLNPDSVGMVILDSAKDRPLGRVTAKIQQVYDIIDKMGIASAKAQKLGGVITSAQKFFQQDDNKLYVMIEGKTCQGILKVGKKNLFIRNESGQMTEIKPLCVLDFYVHESMQRNGIGKQLFERMLQVEKVNPQRLGYDRPSEKLLSFLAKHYHLKRYVPQANNFVVYSQYFDPQVSTKSSTNNNIQNNNGIIGQNKNSQNNSQWQQNEEYGSTGTTGNKKLQQARSQQNSTYSSPSTSSYGMNSNSSRVNRQIDQRPFEKKSKEDLIKEVVEKFAKIDVDEDYGREEEKYSKFQKTTDFKSAKKESLSTCSNSSSEENQWKFQSQTQYNNRQNYVDNRGQNSGNKNSSYGMSSIFGGGYEDNRAGNSKAFDYYSRKY
ncbi:alpha-tubulin n-acetyltransferase [Stylonychia lemnae]|uniref:Alpha-tubulin N-acetyltransferase n=1 Tax=Stylonychia lemnae TaxID=5949 RepID=A0A078BAN2_STYLE|nr:alpha-tubulin n-acetyltransferase [Stylonychia lemnae]|eukprot:CDW90312.1 alpha-tubulin n-acetyltransferase [Stylonychia lemnae]